MVDGTITDLLSGYRSGEPALLAPNRSPLSHSGLYDQVDRTVQAINRLGIGRHDTVAVVLPNGPELASAFLGIAAGARVAPLNPALRDPAYRYYLAHLSPKALLVEPDCASAVVAVARSLKIPILQCVWSRIDPAGTFALSGNPVGPVKTDGAARPDDIALVLHTSGTTSRPKMVPLSQRNLLASAMHIAATLNLSAGDRCLNVMPLFHIHGLVACVLSSLAAGGSAFCAPDFRGAEFFLWFAEAMPTWYSAVPTMHQAVVTNSRFGRVIPDHTRLRFIRSSSAALAPSLMRELEETFDVPVVESYGMTEAAHQMASNPLPPAARKPGTVGLAAGPKVAIMDSLGNILPVGASGEVVIRGPNVMGGYVNNREANEAAFTNGWFRTGDLGIFDDDGYLTITGRIKEQISRGGEKISPQEIDDRLMEHPGVAAAATFPIPHPSLGEEIGTAVVAKHGADLTEKALADFLRGRVAEFKIPRRILFLDDIPKGPTGKIQRNELATLLGMVATSLATADSNQRETRTPTTLEAQLARLWAKALELNEPVGLDENFFMLGGDSLRAEEMLMMVEEKIGRPLPQSILIECGTVAEMAAYIEKDTVSSCLVSIKPGRGRSPFYFVHERSGEVLFVRKLARHLRENQPMIGIQSLGLDGKDEPLTSIEAMAKHYVREIRKYQPAGPYYLGGYSLGGIVAYEMMLQLRAAGEDVAALALIDTLIRQGEDYSVRLSRNWSQLSQLRFSEIGGFLVGRCRNVLRRVAENVRYRVSRAYVRIVDLFRGHTTASFHVRVGDANVKAVRDYQMLPMNGEAVLFRAKASPGEPPEMRNAWREFIRGNLEIREIECNHMEIMNEPHVQKLAAELSDYLGKAYVSRAGKFNLQ